ncbi:unnamed protein product [Candidula unifasciata]|uniref:Polyprenal reductase n=1 Tax=Candidula unifasciata TaxID=100452 RepID=A0A8S3ZS94_9EUPU|nr:unnamed protein product [Candidula unifasciata]
MYFNALSIFWMFSSVLIIVLHNLLPRKSELSKLSNGNNSLRGFLKILLWKLYVFGKLKDSQHDWDHIANGDESNSTRTHASLRHQQLAGTSKQNILLKVTAIPKSWFTHFYLVGALVHFAVFSTLIYVLLGNPFPAALRWLINLINLNIEANDLDDKAWPVLIVFTLEFLQMLRRLYECVFVSTFSKGTMSFVHYFLGMFLYSSFGIGLLASVKLDKLVFAYPSLEEIVYSFLGISLFVWGSYYQHKSMLTFASLRKDKTDHKADEHYIPQGHLFEIVSCPHYLCEILIYFGFCLVFRFINIYLLIVAFFVLTNQMCCGIAVHAWYQEHFSGYPMTRKAVIPYIL